MRFHRLACPVFIVLLLSSPILAQDGAQKEFQERFSIPEQGHFELRFAGTGHLTGREIKTEEDVLKLLDELSQLPFSEERVTSWKLLEEVGLKKIDVPLPEPPVGAKGKVRRVPDWRKFTITFDQENLVQRSELFGLKRVEVLSPQSEVAIQEQGPQRAIVDHYDRGAYRIRSIFDVTRVFQREPGGFEQYYQRQQKGDREFWTWSTPTTKRVIVSRPDKDLIEAIYQPSGDRVYNLVSLHLYHDKPKQAGGIWIPRLVLQLYPASRGKIHYSAFLVLEADFTTQIDPEDFKLTAERDSTYIRREGDFGRDGPRPFVRRLPEDVKDITHLTPAELRKRVFD